MTAPTSPPPTPAPTPPTPTEEQRALPAGDWWCPECKVALDGSRVTYDERCDSCGTPVTVGGIAIEERLRAAEAEIATLRAELEEAKRYPSQCAWESYDGETGDFKGICGNDRPCPKHDKLAPGYGGGAPDTKENKE